MIKPIKKGIWTKDLADTYRVFIRGKEQPEGTTADVESRSGYTKRVTLTGTYSQVSGGYLYWYKAVETPVEDEGLAELDAAVFGL